MIQERAARSRLPLHSPTRPLAAGTMGRGSGEKSFTMVIMNIETVASPAPGNADSRKQVFLMVCLIVAWLMRLDSSKLY